MNGKVVIGCELETKSFDAQINYVESQMQEIEYKLKQADLGFEVGDTQKLEADYEKLGIKLNNLLKKQAQFNQEQANMGKLNLSGIQSNLNSINKGLTQTAKKVAGWGLALFSVYSAYSAISGAVSILSQYNTQLADNIEYIKYSLASTLIPIIQIILNMVVKLLQYINYIAKAFTGKDLFKTADAFKSAQKSAAKTAKSAKEINKQLTGFDEMNVLNDTSSSSAGGGGDDNIASPNIDLTNLQGEIPGWLTWILNNGDTVKRIIEGIAAAILALTNNLSLLQGVGIFLILDGVINLLQDIKKYLDDPSWQNLGKIVQDIGEIILGFSLLAGVTTPLGLVLAVIGQIALIIGSIISLVGNLINFIKEPSWENFVKIWKDAIGSMGIVGQLILWLFDLFGGFEKVVEPLHNFYDWIMDTLIPKIGEDFSKLWNKIKEIFSPVVDFFKNIWDTVSTNIGITIDNVKQIFSFLWDKIKEIFGPVVDWFKDKFQTAYDKIKEIFSPIADFFGEMWDKVKTKLSDFGAKVGEVVGGAFKTVINGVLKTAEKILNTPIKAINRLINKINDIPGIRLTKLETFKLPRLAKGGIINQPGRGVPVGSAIGGERGQEGVLPLTDSQQMQLLGEAIGRYVTINASIINTMNGRVISRELQKINNTNNFAFNR